MNRFRGTITCLVGGLPLALGLALTSVPSSARACGGTFCDSGPTSMPVDQTGETIAFWIDQDGAEPHTEAHIQIQYEGDAERFAWIVPVTAVPEVLVGSQALFDNLLAATVPTFSIITTTTGDCGGGISFGCGKDTASDGVANGTFGDEGGDDGKEGVNILDRGFAGAFEYVTLTGGSVQEVVDWLEMAGYAQDEDAPPILQEYLDEGFVFVAIKLRSGAEVNEIHPLTIRYPGTEPCIPIRLTRIAAVEDMAIRAFFLGDRRVASQNWPSVTLNLLALDWVNGPAFTYNEVVSAAIDEAGGRAFLTEYAGTDSVVSTNELFSNAWDPGAFAEIAPVEVVDELINQGLIEPTLWNECPSCPFVHPQVEPLLSTYLPPPQGMDPHTFWSCLSCEEAQIDPAAWDGVAFSADFAERIRDPGQHALDMLVASEVLTRLFTLLSPHEMIEDPLFHETDQAATVDSNFTATRVLDCGDGPTYFELPDGRTVPVDESGQMPTIEGMPVVETIERVPMTGPPQVETDNGETIDELLAAYSDTRLSGPGGCSSTRLSLEGILTLASIFGIAWFGRRRRADSQ